jgi:hypothetical protein
MSEYVKYIASEPGKESVVVVVVVIIPVVVVKVVNLVLVEDATINAR